MKKIKIMAFPYNDASELEDALNECYERNLLIPLQELKLEENVRIGLQFHPYVSTFLMARSTEVAAETGRGGAERSFSQEFIDELIGDLITLQEHYIDKMADDPESFEVSDLNARIRYLRGEVPEDPEGENC